MCEAGIPLPAMSLRSNVAWTLVGNCIYAISQWGIIVLLTKTAAPELVGRYILALAVTGPLLTFACLQLRSVQATDATNEFRFTDYLALRMMMLLVVMTVIAAVALTGAYRWEAVMVMFALGVARCIEGVSEIFHGLFQQRERMDLVSQSTILKGILSLPGFMAGFHFTQSLIGGVTGLGVAWFLVLMLFDLPEGRKLAVRGSLAESLRSPGVLGRLAWTAFPLGIGAVLVALEMSVPRFFIEDRFGERALGIFAAVACLTAIPAQAINALGQAASPKMAKLHANGERSQFLKLLAKLVGLGLLIGAAGFLFVMIGGQTILQFFYTAEYAQQSGILIWLMAAAGISFGYIFLGTALNALRIFRPRVPIHVLTLSILLLTCHFLGSKWGTTGVACAVFISQIVSAFSYLVVVSYGLRKPQAVAPFPSNSPC